jgi:large subunit ribosomal protein L24
MKWKIKIGDDVEVICGNEKGRQGKVLGVLRQEFRLAVAGVNLRKKHIKKSQKYPDGITLEREVPIHYSNVRKISPSDVRK